MLDFVNNPGWIRIVENHNINFKDEMEINWIDRITWHYRNYKSSFNGELSNAFLSHWSIAHAIDIESGKDPQWEPIDALSETQLSVLKEHIKDMLDHRNIHPSKSLVGAPILIILKPHGRTHQLCVDYLELNRVTIVNWRLLSGIHLLLNRVQSARISTKIDLKTGFHSICDKEGDEWKTAFFTRYGLYKYTVMPFSLANAPATSQDAMETNIRDMLHRGLLIYMDDFLINSEIEEEQTQLVLEVLRTLKENNLPVAADKCV